MNIDRMLAQLQLHEGLRLHAYQDTLGIWTLGIGYNLEARGVDMLERVCGRSFAGPHGALTITADEARAVCREDIARIDAAIRVHWAYYAQLDDVRQRVALDMAFNLGFGALAFKDTIAAIEKRDFSKAVRCLFKSRWAHQVDDGEGGRFGRADRLAKMLLSGHDYTT